MFSFLTPFEIDFDFEIAQQYGLLGGEIHILHQLSTLNIDDYNIAILGVEEERNAINNEGTKYAPNEIRKSLYKLYPGKWKHKILDLGNLKIENKIDDTYHYLKEITTWVTKKNISLIVLGGSQDLTYAITKSFNTNNKTYNLSVIDASIDSLIIDEEIDNNNYLTKLLNDKNSLVLNLNILGVQAYYNHPFKFKLFNDLYVNYYHLGKLINNIEETEPELRESDIISIDINSIKNSVMPGQKESKPNGFDGLNINIISKYSGISVQNKVFGVFEYNPFYDKNKLGANLIAQMIWYYIEGKNAYIDDYPLIPKNDLTKFYVDNEVVQLHFYKNVKSGRWWVEIPKKTNEEILFPCSEKDYQKAIEKKISDRIYRIINKNLL